MNHALLIHQSPADFAARTDPRKKTSFWTTLAALASGPLANNFPLTTLTERSNTMSTQFTSALRMTLPLVALAVVAACSKPEAQGGPPPGPPPVSVAAAVEREVIDTDEFPGRIEAVESVEVRARINGYIQSVDFKPGAQVRKGDLLFVIDPRPLAAEVARAEATLANTRAQLDLSRTELTRNEQLLAEQATSKREYDDAAAKVRQLEAQIRANQASLETARLNLAYTRVTAPINGRVGKAEITVGNLVQGEVPNSPLLTTVVSADPIYASFEADEGAYLKYIGKARGGALTVAVGLADEQGFPHSGRLEFVDNRVDPQSGTVRMRTILDNKDGRLTPGLFARVKLGDSATPRRAVLVADRAIGTDQSKRFVLVVNADNKAQYREVRIGRLAEGLRVVESGLKPGEVIVVNGLQRVRPGAPVTPQTVPMEARAPGQPERLAAKE
jgi:multidrug efflux system membrane fusion protein